MASIDVNKWLMLAANFGVLLGVALVVYEIRQNSELMQVQIRQARADAAVVSNEQTFESAYIPTIMSTSSKVCLRVIWPIEQMRKGRFWPLADCR